MKKILLIIILVLAIFQMVVLATDIYIGAPAIDRGASLGAYTMINDNPANESGIINNVEIWASTSLVNCEVAIFYKPDPGGFPNNFTTKDVQFIGAVTSGSKQTFPVDLDVVAGDYIGIYFTSGNIERDSSGCDGMWYKSNDRIPCANLAFTNLATSAISLYGTGETVVVGWDHKWNTQTISKWNTKEFSKWNGLE